MIFVSFMNPYRASRRTTTFIVIEYGLALYIYCSAWSKNLRRIDGLLSILISGLSLSYSLSVGILLFIDWVVRWNKSMEHFSYAPHPNYFYLEIVASLSYSGSLATVRMVRADVRPATICHAIRAHARDGKRW